MYVSIHALSVSTECNMCHFLVLQRREAISFERGDKNATYVRMLGMYSIFLHTI